MEKLETLKKSAEELLKIAKDIQSTGDMQTISELERRGVENLRVIEAAMAYAGIGLYDVVRTQRVAVSNGTFKPAKKETKKPAAKKPATKKSK